MTLKELFTSIADTIRGRNQYAPEKIRAYDFPGEIENACNESEMLGWNIGMEQGLEEGIQQGKQEEYNRFWDGFQDYGNKPQYTYAFFGWYDGAYNPKYPIVCQVNWSTGYIFRGAYITDTLVDIELQGNNQASGMFYDCYELVTVRKLKLDETCNIVDSFRNCKKLKNITFEGEIGVTLDFHWSPLLTVVSLRSILTALSKNATYASGKTITFNTASKAVIEADAECSAQLASAVSAGWTVAYNS